MNFRYEAEAYLRGDDPVYDGDTIRVYIRPWIGERRRETIRVLGVDTAELYGDKHDTAVEQKGFVRDWLGSEAGGGGEYPLVVEAKGEGSFGRTLAKVRRKTDGEDLSQAILDEYGEEYEYDE
jgi:endonuclease YncB( thermonuclease family)